MKVAQTELNETRQVADDVKGAFTDARSTVDGVVKGIPAVVHTDAPVDGAVAGTVAVGQTEAPSADAVVAPSLVRVGTSSTPGDGRATADELLPPY